MPLSLISPAFADGAPIPGLFTAGNDMASVLGGHYPAGGVNLGPAMTFGYVAARHIAGRLANDDEDEIASG